VQVAFTSLPLLPRNTGDIVDTIGTLPHASADVKMTSLLKAVDEPKCMTKSFEICIFQTCQQSRHNCVAQVSLLPARFKWGQAVSGIG
jgi:hypothetical protein